MNENFKNIRTLFWIAFAISIIAFFCPFVQNDSGIYVYSEIFEDMSKRRWDFKMFFIFFLLVSIVSWLPLMAYSFHRYTRQKRHYTIDQRLINYFLFAIGFSIYVLPAYAMYDNQDIFKLFSWGYWLLLVSMSIMFVCYLVVQKEQLIDDDDMSEHLINND